MRKPTVKPRPFISPRPVPKKPESLESTLQPSEKYVQTSFDLEAFLDDENGANT